SFEKWHSANPIFFRSGRVDSWKEHVTEEDHRYFWEKSYPQMLRHGYVNDLPLGFSKHVAA
ncbi:MAG: hypothetical protein LBH94_07475, partial [Deltaproteobacteria bacterium]|nr:hypothetical protein [Deltaproteobacteria bacterium]